jgi:hypothetical protein
MSGYTRLTLYGSDQILSEFANDNDEELRAEIRYGRAGLLGRFTITKSGDGFVLVFDSLNNNYRGEINEIKEPEDNAYRFANLQELKSFITAAINIIRTESSATTYGSDYGSDGTGHGRKSKKSKKSRKSRKTKKSKRKASRKSRRHRR